jgi:putative endonuclease
VFGRSSPPAGGGRASDYILFMYQVYAIYNKLADKIYIGQTSDLTQRINLHNIKAFKGYTSRFDGEWQLIYSEKVDTR